MTDPGAEMKARAEKFWDEKLKNNPTFYFNHLSEPNANARMKCTLFAAAFAAKEVARSEKVAMALTVLLRAKCSDKEWEALPKELTSVADDALARAVEDERMANCKAICKVCLSGFISARPALPAERNEDGEWVHFTESVHKIIGRKLSCNCKASAIHERSQVKGEGL